jgi:hypothetical protein
MKRKVHTELLWKDERLERVTQEEIEKIFK